MWVRMMPFGSFAASPEPLTNYYVHPKSMSASPERMLEGLRAIVEEPILLARYRGIERWIWRRRISAITTVQRSLDCQRQQPQRRSPLY